MAQSTDKITFDNIKERFEKMFAPDIRFTWNEQKKMYILTSITTAGEVWMKKEFLSKDYNAEVSYKIVDHIMKLAGNSGLCYEVIEGKEKKTYDTMKGKFCHSRPINTSK